MTITDRILTTLDERSRVVGIFNLAIDILECQNVYWVRQCLRRLEADKKIKMISHGSGRGRATEIYRRQQR